MPLYLQWVNAQTQKMMLKHMGRPAIRRKEIKALIDRLRRRILLDENISANYVMCFDHGVLYYPRCRSRFSQYWG